MQTIYLDISNKGVTPTIYAKQGDVGRKILAIFTDSGIPYKIPAGAVFSVWYEGDSGEGNYTHIGEAPAISVDGNKVIVELISQMLQNEGCGNLCLVLNNGDKQIGSWNIEYCVESVPGVDSQEAQDYYTAFSKTVDELLDVANQLNGGDYISEGSIAFGVGNSVGLLGYYFSNIDFDTKEVTLSAKNDGYADPGEISWAVGDVVSITNGNNKYEDCSTITAVNGNVITLDTIPFTEISQATNPAFDDRSIYVSAKPEAGVVDLGKGATAFGVGNKANNYCAIALGGDNEVTGQNGVAAGKANKVKAYAGAATGYMNTVHSGAKYSRVGGIYCEATGIHSVAEGEENKAVGKGSVAQGYKTTANGNYSHTIGGNTSTSEIGMYAFAAGNSTTANAKYSFVAGIRNTSKWEGQFVTGRYNSDPAKLEVFTVGCGTSTSNRANALGVRADGTTDVYGHRIVNVAAAEDAADAVNKAQLDSRLVEDPNHPGCYYRIANGKTEWLNPPMMAGVEYRTTERLAGYGVYTKVIHIVGVPANTYSQISAGESGISLIFKQSGYVVGTGDSVVTLPVESNGDRIWSYAAGDSVFLWSNFDHAGQYKSAAIQVWYLKYDEG